MNSYSSNWNTKAWLSQLVNFKNAIWTSEERYAIKLCFKLGKNAMRWKLGLLLWPRDRVPSGSVQALPDPRRLDRANPPTNFWWSLLLTALAWSICTGFRLDRQSTRNTVEVLREFRKRFQGKRPALFKSGQWHFHQDNTPVHNSILVIDYLTNMGINTVRHPPYSPDLAPSDCGYSLSSEAVVMRQLRRWKRLWRRSLTRSHKRTSMGPSRSCWNGTISALQPEEITSKGIRVSCVYYQ